MESVDWETKSSLAERLGFAVKEKIAQLNLTEAELGRRISRKLELKATTLRTTINVISTGKSNIYGIFPADNSRDPQRALDKLSIILKEIGIEETNSVIDEIRGVYFSFIY